VDARAEVENAYRRQLDTMVAVTGMFGGHGPAGGDGKGSNHIAVVVARNME
jgi:hypothetical protein